MAIYNFIEVQNIVYSLIDKKQEEPFHLQEVIEKIQKKGFVARAGPGYGVDQFLDNLVVCGVLRKPEFDTYVRNRYSTKTK